MTLIRVNPNTLNRTAGSVTQVGGGVCKLGDDVWRSASSAPSYQGQFGPKVRAIGQSALSQAQKHSTRMNQLSGSLGKRASAFIKADTIITESIISDFFPNIKNDANLLIKMAAMLGLSIHQILQILHLGALFSPPTSGIMVTTSKLALETQGQVLGASTKRSVFDIIISFISEQWSRLFNKDDAEQYPEPVPTNNNAKPSTNGSCAIYAAAKRTDLGNTGGEDHGAYNYRHKFSNKAFQVNSNVNLRTKIAEGYAVVWDPGIIVVGTSKSNSTYGHVAIVEKVYEDKIIISHSGWQTGTRTEIPISDISNGWFIP